GGGAFVRKPGRRIGEPFGNIAPADTAARLDVAVDAGSVGDDLPGAGVGHFEGIGKLDPDRPAGVFECGQPLLHVVAVVRRDVAAAGPDEIELHVIDRPGLGEQVGVALDVLDRAAAGIDDFISLGLAGAGVAGNGGVGNGFGADDGIGADDLRVGVVSGD